MDNSKKDFILGVLLIIFVMVVIWGALNYFRQSIDTTAEPEDPVEICNEIPSWIRVYTISGNLIEEYTGAVDIVYERDLIMFKDESGLKHTIYCPVSTVTIDEVGG